MFWALLTMATCLLYCMLYLKCATFLLLAVTVASGHLHIVYTQTCSTSTVNLLVSVFAPIITGLLLVI